MRAARIAIRSSKLVMRISDRHRAAEVRYRACRMGQRPGYAQRVEARLIDEVCHAGGGWYERDRPDRRHRWGDRLQRRAIDGEVDLPMSLRVTAGRRCYLKAV